MSGKKTRVIQLVPATESEWTASTGIIPRGVMCFATDTGRIKIGTGKLAYNALGFSVDAVLTQAEKLILVKRNQAGGVVVLDDTTGKISPQFFPPLQLTSPDGSVAIQSTPDTFNATITLPTTGVTAGVYGDAAYTLSATIDDRGRITSAQRTLITPAYTSIQNVPTKIAQLGALADSTDTMLYFNTAGAVATSPISAYMRGLMTQATRSSLVDALQLTPGTYVQAYSAALQSISGVSTAANQLLYTTAANTFVATILSPFMRTVLDDTDQASAQSTLGLVIGTNVQAYNATLQGLSAIPLSTNTLIYGSGAGTAASTAFTALGRSLAGAATASAAQATLALVPGTDILAYNARLQAIAQAAAASDKLMYSTGVNTIGVADFTAYARTIMALSSRAALQSELQLGTAAYQATSAFQSTNAALTSISGLSTSADQMIYTTAANTYSTTPLTSFARTLLDDTSQAGMQSTLGLIPGSTIQAYDAGLASFAALAGSGVVVATATDTYTLRDIGVSSATSLLDRQSADGRYLSLSNTNASVSGTINFTGNIQIGGVNVASVDYVESRLSGSVQKGNAAAATTANITLSGIQTIDTVSGSADMVILVKDQTNKAENGLYLMKSGAWVRTTNMDTWSEVPGATVLVLGGTTGRINTAWRVYASMTGTLGTTDINWTQDSGAGTYTASNGVAISGSDFQLTGQALAMHNMATNGFFVRTGSSTVASRSFVGPGAGLSISNADGVAGNVTFLLTNDLSAVEGLSGTGFAVRTAADTWTTRSLAGTTNQVILSNDGITGNITFSLPQSIATSSTPSFAGMTLTNLLNFNAGIGDINNGIRWQGGTKDMRLMMKDANRVVLTDETDGQELFSFYETGLFQNHVGNIQTVGQLVSTVSTGTAPLVVSSTTQVNNLNAQLHGGLSTSQLLRSDQNGTIGGTLTVTTLLSINGSATASRALEYKTAGVNRWRQEVWGTGDGGSNAGSDWYLNRHGDDGVFLSTVMSASRATGVVSFSTTPMVSGSTVWHAGNFTPSNYAVLSSANTYTATQTIDVPAGGGDALVVSRAAGDWGHIKFKTGTANRFTLAINGTAEGANAGSDLELYRYADNGTSARVFQVERSTGIVYFTAALYVGSSQVWHAGNFTPANYAALSGATFTGTVGISSVSPWLGFAETDQTNGVGRWAWNAESGSYYLKRNTATAGDFSTNQNVITINSTGQLILDQQLTAPAYSASGKSVGGNVGDNAWASSLSVMSGNNNLLVTQLVRHTAGTDWTGCSYEMRRRVDVTDHGFIRFGYNGDSQGLSFGTGTTEYLKMDNSGNWTFGSTSNRTVSIAGTNSNLTARYDDNSLASPIFINNFGVTAAGNGTGILASMGAGGSFGANAGYIRWNATDTWAAAANRSARLELGYVNAGTLTTGLSIDPNGVSASRYISTVATGTAPLSVSSATMVTNLNSQLWQGYTPTGRDNSILKDAGSYLAGGLYYNGGWKFQKATGNTGFYIRHSDAPGVTAGQGGRLDFGFTSGNSTEVDSAATVDRVFSLDRSGQLIVPAPQGTAPFVVSSTTQVTNLNAHLLNNMGSSVNTDANSIAARDGNGYLSAAWLQAFGTQALINVQKSDGPVDAKKWDWFGGIANKLSLRLVNDAYSASTDVLTVTRSGMSVSSVDVFTNVTATGTITTNSKIVVAGSSQSTGMDIYACATGEGPEIRSFAADGSYASMTQVANGKILMDYSVNAYVGSAYQDVFYQRIAAGTVSGGYCPAIYSWIFRNGASFVEPMRATFNGVTFSVPVTSTVAQGTAPFVVSSTTRVTNLNADMLDDMTATSAATANSVAARDGNGDLLARSLIGYAGTAFNIDTYAQTGGYWAGIYGSTGTGSSGTAPANFVTVAQLHSNGSNQGIQLAASYAADQSYYIRRRSDNPSAPNGAGVWQPWNKLVTSADRGVANGVATLDGSGTIPVSQLPSSVSSGVTKQMMYFMSTM